MFVIVRLDPVNGDVRLAGSSSYYEGRVEIYYQGEWGTVCDDNFDNLDAQVVCRHIGYTTVSAETIDSDYFGEGSGPILLDELGCWGGECRLDLCYNSGWRNHDCNHYEDVGVRCHGMIIMEYCSMITY